MAAGQDIKTLLYEDFSAGIDLREGPIVRDSRKFEDLENCLITFGRKLIRRMPFEQLEGELDALSQGIGYLNGRYIAIAPADSSISHTIVGIPITTLYFDLPEYTSDWEVLDSTILNEVVVVAIRHTFPGGAVTSRIMLHVWDGVRPTWVDDPACPTNWTPSLPLNTFDTADATSFKDYTPRLAVVADKLHMPHPSGDTAFSAVNRPRVWSDRDANDILDNGRWWYFITPPGTTPFSFTLPIPYNDLIQEKKYAAYVAERLFDNGSWRQFREVPSITMSGDYTVEPVANRFDAAKPDETLITCQWANPGGKIIRFRALARPAVTVTAGCVLTPSGGITGGALDIEGASHPMSPVAISGLSADTFYYVLAIAPGAPIPIANTYEGGIGSMPLNGQQRYWSRIIAVAETDGTGNAFSFDYTGTVDVTTGQISVEGSGTSFLSEAIPGETVRIGGEARIIDAVVSDTRMVTKIAWSVTESGVIPLRDVTYDYAHEVGDSGNLWYAQRDTEASFVLAGADNAGVLNTSLYDPSGSVPIALGAAQNRLLVQFAESLQLWGVQPDPALNAHLATMAVGAGHNTSPRAALVDGYIVLPTHAGPRMFAPDGQNKDYINEVQIGDLIYKRVKTVDFSAAAWWPRYRAFVTCAQEQDGENVDLWVFAYHPKDKTTAWSRFTIDGLTRVDRLFVAQDTLYILSDHTLWRAQPDALVFRDSGEVAGEAYESRARWLFNDFGAPTKNKKLLTIDISQEGTSRVLLYSSPVLSTDATTGPDVEGLTIGKQTVQLGLLTPGVALEIISQDEAGHSLDFVGFTYALLRR
jgi:hypothetical protein